MAINRAYPDVQLSILDLGRIYKGRSASQSLQSSAETIKLADHLGYTRYWFAEHHNVDGLISTSPDIMTAHAAAITTNLRVGSGGIMLPNHSPLKVAENFSILEALYPGRIDLGIGRASGTDSVTIQALKQSNSWMMDYDFSTQFDELLAFFHHSFPKNHPYHKIKSTADPSLVPDLFMLGSSNGGIQFAIEKGLGFAFAGQLNPDLAIPILQFYRKHFKPGIWAEPKSILSIIVIVADTDEEAHYLAGPAVLQWAQSATGNSQGLTTPEEAASYLYSPREERAKLGNEGRFIIGNAVHAAEKLRKLAAEALVDKIMIFDMYPNLESRINAYKLLAEQFHLTAKNQGRRTT